MGHRRLGRLPKTVGWKRLIAALDSPDINAALVAELTARETKEILLDLASNPAINYAQWLLTRIVWFARSDNFSEELRAIGVDVPSDAHAVQFFARVFDHAEKEMRLRSSMTPFVSFVEQALRQTLTETVKEKSTTLFGTGIADIQEACREHSTKKGFGIIAKRFYSNVLNRFLNYFVQREISNHIGPSKNFNNISSASDFTESIKTYCMQSARIVQDYASGWYSKHTWITKGQLSEVDVRPLTSYAFTKLQMEMAKEDTKR